MSGDIFFKDKSPISLAERPDKESTIAYLISRDPLFVQRALDFVDNSREFGEWNYSGNRGTNPSHHRDTVTSYNHVFHYELGNNRTTPALTLTYKGNHFNCEKRFTSERSSQLLKHITQGNPNQVILINNEIDEVNEEIMRVTHELYSDYQI